MGNAKLHLVSGFVEAPLGFTGPYILLGCTHQAAPVTLVVKHKFILVCAVVCKLRISAAAPVEVTLRVVVWAGSCGSLRCFRNGHLGGRCIAPVKLYLVALLSLSANENWIPLIFVKARAGIHLGNLAGLYIGLRILGQGEVIPVFALGAVFTDIVEPYALVSGVVDDVVHIDADVVLVGFRDKVLEVILRAVTLLYGGVILHVIAVVALGGMERREPQAGYAKFVKVIQAFSNAV